MVRPKVLAGSAEEHVAVGAGLGDRFELDEANSRGGGRARGGMCTLPVEVT